MDLGKTIKRLRKQRNFTQKFFSSKCQITQTYLSQIENNLKDPNLGTLKKIGEALEVPLPIVFYLSLNEEDVPYEKRKAFEMVNPPIKSLINEFFAV